MDANAHTCATATPSDAPRASKPPLARNQTVYAVQCKDACCHGNWFIAHRRNTLYCPYCADIRRIQSRHRAKMIYNPPELTFADALKARNLELACAVAELRDVAAVQHD